MTHKLGHNLVMVWQSIQVTSLKDWIGWGARDNKRVCCEAALTKAFPFGILKKKSRRKKLNNSRKKLKVFATFDVLFSKQLYFNNICNYIGMLLPMKDNSLPKFRVFLKLSTKLY